MLYGVHIVTAQETSSDACPALCGLQLQSLILTLFFFIIQLLAMVW